MGQPSQPLPALLIVAAFSRHEAALLEARRQAVETWGPIAAEGPLVDFVETDYYVASMGSHLRKTLWAFDRLIAPEHLPELKLQTNRWEARCAESGSYAEPRPLNLDPGYLTLAKFVLASTKDHAHRIYLRDGIYAEVTLHYRQGRWQPWPWTYPDYQRPDRLDFLEHCRNLLRQRLRSYDRSHDTRRTGE